MDCKNIEKKHPLEIAYTLSEIKKPYFSTLNPEMDVRVELKPEEWEDIQQAAEYLKQAYTPKLTPEKFMRYVFRLFPLFFFLIIWTGIVAYKAFNGEMENGGVYGVIVMYAFICIWYGIGYYKIYVKKS